MKNKNIIATIINSSLPPLHGATYDEPHNEYFIHTTNTYPTYFSHSFTEWHRGSGLYIGFVYQCYLTPRIMSFNQSSMHWPCYHNSVRKLDWLVSQRFQHDIIMVWIMKKRPFFQIFALVVYPNLAWCIT